ncbi:MAG: TIR domain-containing protein [Acidimicrobiales bacterium]
MEARRFDVFLSYNSTDRAAVERIATRLRELRLEPWWDQWALTPGGSWQEEIVGGLQASGSCAVMVGPAGLGAWAREELAVAQNQAATDRAFRIFMVLLPGAPELSDPSLAFLSTRTWVDLRNGTADHDGLQDLVCAITGVPRRRDVAVATDDTCPYRGLEAFEQAHADFFFGRDDDVALVVDKLKASRFLAVLGPSGSGKSSLLRAGLVPVLRRGGLDGSEDWRVGVLTPGPRPLTNLAATLAHLFAGPAVQQTLDAMRADTRSLDLAASVALDQRPAGDRVVLVIDQFEELFTLCGSEDERKAFLGNLVYAATVPGGQVVVIVGMRSDFYTRFAPYHELRLLVANQQFLVGPLDADGLRKAIEEPARRVGLEFEAGLAETMMADIDERPGSLPLLQHVLLELWRRRRATMLTLEAYVASGGVEGALAQRANATYTSFSPRQRDIARRVLLRLVQPGEGAEDTRRRAGMDELVTRPDEQDDVDAVVSAMADQRLLTTASEEPSGAAVVDLTHEALIRGWPELRTWVNEDREALRSQRRLTDAAAEWDRRGGHDDDLYAGARLAYWNERGMEELPQLERNFVTRGLRREARQRAAGRRRARLAVAGAGLGVTLVAVVALVGLRSVANERDIAANQRDIAVSRQLAAQAAASLQDDTARGLQLAADAYERKPTREAQLVLREAALTPGSRNVRLRGHKGTVFTAVFSPDGKRVVSASRDGTVRVWDWAGGGEPAVLRGHKGRVYTAGFSPDGKRVVSAGVDGTVRVWDWAGGGEPAVLGGHEGIVVTAGFSPDGKRVVSAGIDGTVRVWDWDGGGEPAVLRGHEGSVATAVFSPDGKRVVSASSDGTVRVWDWAGGGEPAVLRGHEGIVYTAGFSLDGKRVVSAGEDGTARVWDWAGGGEPAVLRGHEDSVGAEFSPDGKQVVSASLDETVRVWDWAGGGEPAVLRGHNGAVSTAGFSPDGKRVVSAGDDGTVRVWDWAGGGEPAVLRGHQGRVGTAEFSRDGKRVVSAGDDGPVRVWDWAGGGEPAVLRGHEGGVFTGVLTAGFSPDGKRVVSAGDDGTVRVWDCQFACGPLREVVALARSPLSR